MQLTMFEQEQASLPQSLYGKTSPVSSVTKGTPSDVFLAHSLGKTARLSQQGVDGRTLVVCMDPKEQSRGGFLTPNISAWPNAAAVCSLSQVLEQTSIPARFFLSATACEGILRRAEKRGKTLPAPLQAALQAVAFPEQTKSAPGTCSPSSWPMDKGGAEIRTDGGAPCLTCNHEAPIVVHGTQDPDTLRGLAHTLWRNQGQGNAVCVTGEITHTLRAEGADASEDGTGRGTPIVFDPNQITSPDNRSNPQPGAACHTLPAKHEPPVVTWSNAVCPTLRAGGNTSGGDRPPGTDVDTADSNVVIGSSVRRLTPVECERLQGFPDGYTAIPWRGKDVAECPDGPRYKALGNSKAVPVVRWIGRRIEMVLHAVC